MGPDRSSRPALEGACVRKPAYPGSRPRENWSSVLSSTACLTSLLPGAGLVPCATASGLAVDDGMNPAGLDRQGTHALAHNCLGPWKWQLR